MWLLGHSASSSSVIKPGPLPNSSTDIPSRSPNHVRLRASFAHAQNACPRSRSISLSMHAFISLALYGAVGSITVSAIGDCPPASVVLLAALVPLRLFLRLGYRQRIVSRSINGQIPDKIGCKAGLL